MRPTVFATVGLIGIMGCVEPRQEDSTPEQLVLEPTTVTVTVVDGHAIVQPYRATLVDSDGASHDVTAQTTFILRDGEFGDWSASTLSITGTALGPTRVVAAYGSLQAHSALTVYALAHRFDTDAPDNAPAMFAQAKVDTSCEPGISYPADLTVMPKNLGELDVQWQDSHDDLFEVSLATTYLDTRIYTHRATETAAWTKLAAADWNRLADQQEPIELRVTGVVEATPKLACAAVPQHIYVTDQPLAGTVYMANQDGVQRFDAAHPTLAPDLVFSSAMWDAMFAPIADGSAFNCVGCSFSRDGSQFAVTSATTGGIYDFTTGTLTAPGTQSWSFATFNVNGSKLITSVDGDLRVITGNGTLLTTLPHESDFLAFDPQVSPDGRWLANVKSVTDAGFTATTIVVRTFYDGTNEMGSTKELFPIEPGTASYFPAWSPDGGWIVFTRTTGIGTVNTTAALWIVRADGSEPPIQLTAPSQHLAIRAHFVPATMTTGGERLYYLAVDSRAAFGEQLAAGRMQLWLQPFYPDRPVETVIPCSTLTTGCTPMLRATSPALHMPQSLAVDNHLIQWLE